MSGLSCIDCEHWKQLADSQHKRVMELEHDLAVLKEGFKLLNDSRDKSFKLLSELEKLLEIKRPMQ